MNTESATQEIDYKVLLKKYIAHVRGYAERDFLVIRYPKSPLEKEDFDVLNIISKL